VAEYRPGPPRRGHGSGRREQPHRLGPGLEQRGGARSPGGARGEHVVDEHDPSRGALRLEHPAHRLAPRSRPAASLRSRVPEAPDERDGRHAQPGGDRPRERPGLVVAARREPLSGQRHPRDGARRPRDSGTHVMALGVHGTSAHASVIATPSAPATARNPPNFNRWIERRIGPSNPNGARAIAMASGGQSRHEVTGRDAGAPHRSHHGGESTTSCERHARQNGHDPEPQPAHRLGNSTSSNAASTRRRYPALPTPGVTGARCRSPPPNPCRAPSARPAAPRRSASTGTPSPCRVRSPRRTPARAPLADAHQRTAST
jgi:hypothetical protein